MYELLCEVLMKGKIDEIIEKKLVEDDFRKTDLDEETCPVHHSMWTGMWCLHTILSLQQQNAHVCWEICSFFSHEEIDTPFMLVW